MHMSDMYRISKQKLRVYDVNDVVDKTLLPKKFKPQSMSSHFKFWDLVAATSFLFLRIGDFFLIHYYATGILFNFFDEIGIKTQSAMNQGSS